MSNGDADSLFASHPTWMELDAHALHHNLAQIRKRINPEVKVIASVKANGYGHGIVPVCKILQQAGVDMLTTGSFYDAKALRNAGINTPIIMLGGSLPSGMVELIEANLIPTIYNMEAAVAADAAASSLRSDDKVPVFIKVDCGMGRLGVSLSNAVTFIKRVSKLKNIWIQGLYTHLSFKNESGMKFAEKRLSLFYDLVLELEKHGYKIPITQALASSAITVRWKDQCSAICPGHILYGLPSVNSSLGEIKEFLPVCKNIKTRVIHIADHENGPAIGTGGYHINRSFSRTCVVPFGLNDGNRSSLNGKKPVVLFKGARLAVLGVSLEHLTLEIPDDTEINLGDTITIIGQSGDECIDMSEYSSWFNTSELETMLTLSNRMPIVVINKDEAV